MATSTKLVKELRDRTACGIKDCKKALTECNDDIEKAIEFLRKKGLADAAKKSGRGTNAGKIISYIHAGGQMGVLLELNCETDFVGNTDAFMDLGKDICMHICAMNPVAVTREEIPEDIIQKEKDIYLEQIGNKPDNIKEKIVAGKLEKYYKENVLLEQPYVKEDKKSVEDIIKENIGKIKENITVTRFARFQIGE